MTFGQYHPDIDRLPYVEAVRKASGTGRWLPFFKYKNAFVQESLPSAVSAIIKKYISKAGDFDYLAFDNLGGKNDESKPTDSAFVHRDLAAWFHVGAQWSNEQEEPEKLAWITSFYEELTPYLTFQVYQNTPDLALDHALERYYGENLPRLREIKTIYDPKNVFHYEQSIPPL